MTKSFNKAFIIFFVAISIVVIFAFLKILFIKTVYSILLASLISFLNFVIFVIMFKYSIKKSNKFFLLFSIGGVIFRLFLMLAFVIAMLKFLKVDVFSFIFAFFLWYVYFLTFEISIVQLKTKNFVTKS